MPLTTSPLALLTPTYRADLERFRILREALEAFDCNWPHIVVVQTEDLPLFRNALGSTRVEWLASAEILPTEVEQARQRISRWPDAVRKLRRSLNKRVGWFPDATCDGWHAQQLVKLAVPALFPYSAFVTLDSDLVPTAPLRAECYLRENRAALMAENTPGFAHWADAAARVLGLPEGAVRPMNFVAHPFVFHPEAIRGLHAHLEARHARPWWRALLDQRPGDLSEFTVYGAYVRLVSGGAHHFESPANATTRWVITAEDRAQVSALIAQAFADPAIEFLVLQASRNWPVQPYVPAIRAALSAAQ